MPIVEHLLLYVRLFSILEIYQRRFQHRRAFVEHARLECLLYMFQHLIGKIVCTLFVLVWGSLCRAESVDIDGTPMVTNIAKSVLLSVIDVVLHVS